jgi:hypothetical protein
VLVKIVGELSCAYWIVALVDDSQVESIKQGHQQTQVGISDQYPATPQVP